MGTVSTALELVLVPCRGVCTDGSARYLDMRWAVDTPIDDSFSSRWLSSRKQQSCRRDRAFLLPFAAPRSRRHSTNPASFRLLPL